MATDNPDFDAILQKGMQYALSLTHSHADAEDLLHDAWVKLVDAQGPWRKGYLFRTIRNLFIDNYRHQQVIKFEPLPEGDQGVADNPHQADEPISADHESLQQALTKLRFEERECLYLQAVEGYTAAEIAHLCNHPRGTVLSMIYRAKQKLRRLLSANEVEVSS